jgi:hypothetical protein
LKSPIERLDSFVLLLSCGTNDMYLKSPIFRLDSFVLSLSCDTNDMYFKKSNLLIGLFYFSPAL